MLTLSKKLLLNKKIALGVPDYNSFHKMCRINDFKESFWLCEDLIFDILKFKKSNPEYNLESLIDIKKKILIIDDSSSAVEDYWGYAMPRDVCFRDNIPQDLSEYWIIVESLFSPNKKTIFSELQIDDQLCVSLVSENNKLELNNVFFNSSYKISYSTINKSFRLTGSIKNLMGKEKFFMDYGPWPKPLKDWDTLALIPVSNEIIEIFGK